MLEVPKKKYAEFSGDARTLVDFMIDRLLELMEKEPTLAADVLPVPKDKRRPAIISLMDRGLLKLATDMWHIWWTIHLFNEYIPIGQRHRSPERN